MAYLCSTLSTYTYTDEVFSLYSVLILSVFLHVFWKLTDTRGTQQYHLKPWGQFGCRYPIRGSSETRRRNYKQQNYLRKDYASWLETLNNLMMILCHLDTRINYLQNCWEDIGWGLNIMLIRSEGEVEVCAFHSEVPLGGCIAKLLNASQRTHWSMWTVTKTIYLYT